MAPSILGGILNTRSCNFLIINYTFRDNLDIHPSRLTRLQASVNSKTLNHGLEHFE